MPYMRLLVLLFVIGARFSYAQLFLLSGTITDEKNNPLPFASVIVKGTSIGTTSNADGLFNLRLKPGQYDILFQYVGYKKESKPVTISGDTKLNAVLQSDNYQLKEVQITAGEDPAY